MKTGELLISILDGFYAREPSGSFFTIIETGCIRDANAYEDMPIGHGSEGAGWSTLYFAKWVREKEGTSFHSCDIDQSHIDTAKELLSTKHVNESWVQFHNCDSVDFIRTFQGQIDFAYLDSGDSLQHGLEEFRACEDNHVPVIVMDDFQSKCLMAYAYALGKGYKIERNHRFTIFELS